jgi:hypothetical protein
MKTFRDFILAHPEDNDCIACMQPHNWPSIGMCLLGELRDRVNGPWTITELRDLEKFCKAIGEDAFPEDCQVIWDQFIRWQRQQLKMQQLGANYGISTAQ